LKKEKTSKVGDYLVDNPVLEDEEVPKGITSNFHPGFLHEVCKEYLLLNFNAIRDTAKDVILHFLIQNSVVLTEGKQTWYPLTEASVPSAIAYVPWCDFMEENGFPRSHTLLELIKYIPKKKFLTKKQLLLAVISDVQPKFSIFRLSQPKTF
jgi:hypothetical protein